MKAVICTQYGGPEVLQLTEVNKPIPKSNEVLIKIHATAVTASDGLLRALKVPGGHQFPLQQMLRFAMRLLIGFSRPRNPILGLVFSGEVESLGAEVHSFQIGDEVFGFTGLSRGAYAAYKCVSLKEIQAGEIQLKPNEMSHEEVSAITYGGVLAMHFMRRANISKGQKVLIYGASGAIGTMAVQLAKYLGAEVTAVCSTENFGLVASLGAEKMIDYTKEGASNSLEKYDFILDAVGKNKSSDLKKACRQALTQSGNYASVDDGLLQVKDDYLQKLKNLAESGIIQAVIDKQYSLKDMVKAHQYLDQGHKKGNIIIQIRD